MATKRKGNALSVTEGSGNVFADLEFAKPGEELSKARFASRIRSVIERRGLTQANAAELMGMGQPEVSALLDGRLTHFSSDRLERLLIALG